MCAYTFLSVTINMIAPFGGGGPTRTPATPPTAHRRRLVPAAPRRTRCPLALPARARAPTQTHHTRAARAAGSLLGSGSACPTVGRHGSCTFGRLRLGSSRRPIADARGVSNKPIVERRRCILEWSWRIHTHTAKCARLRLTTMRARSHTTLLQRRRALADRRPRRPAACALDPDRRHPPELKCWARAIPIHWTLPA